MRRLHGAAAILCVASHVAFAATHTWSGPMVGGTWSNPANWGGGIPTSNEAGGTIVVFLSGTVSSQDIPSLVINEVHFIGGGNVVMGSALSFGSAPSPDQTHIRSEVGGNLLAPTLAVSASSGLLVTVASGTLTIAGTLSGNAPILQGANAGTLVLSGSNLFTGFVNVNDGTVALSSSGTNTAIPPTASDHVFVGDFMGTPDTAILKNLLDDQVADALEIVLGPDGLYDLNGRNETVRDLETFVPGGNVTLGSGTLTLATPSGVIAQYDGTIAGAGSLVKSDQGLQVFTGANTYTGTTTVSAGTLVTNGNQPGSAVTVNGTGVLLGSGTIGTLSLQAGGTVSPGGDFSYQFGNTAILHVNGGLTGFAGGVYKPDLSGTTPGTGYDQIAVTGDASPGGATLDPYLTFTPSTGTVLTVLTCGGTLTGTFAGLPNGSSLLFGPVEMRVDYTTNAVTLTRCASGTPTVTPPSDVIVTQSTCE